MSRRRPRKKAGLTETFLTSLELNMRTYHVYIKRLKNYYLNMFEWKGLPDSVNTFYLENQLFHRGYILFYFDERYGYLALEGVLESDVNLYNEPTKYRAFAPNGYEKKLTNKNAVVIYNDLSREPMFQDVEMYAHRLTLVERTIDVNLETQKTPKVARVSPEQRLSMMNVMKQYDGFESMIWGDKHLDLKDSVEVLDLSTPFIAPELMLYKHDLWNEAMTMLGIGNTNQDKKERLVQAEAEGNNEQIQASREVMLNARRMACEQINKMFPDLNVSVDFRLEGRDEGDDSNKLEGEDKK
ncbi:hypothetical protein [Bacillus altitudinis]|uniref:hypothetical protein n=1 Tax=Bacillus altitudinis TaxID=293387 RepID=UPI003D2055C2